MLVIVLLLVIDTWRTITIMSMSTIREFISNCSSCACFFPAGVVGHGSGWNRFLLD